MVWLNRNHYCVCVCC